jgi:hypothetical protein
MFRILAALTISLGLSMPAFAQGPSNVIVNQGSFNFNKIVNVGAPAYYPAYYPSYPVYPVPGPSTFIQNVGSGNVNVVKNIGWGGAGAQNTIVNVGNGNVNKIINR